MKRSFHDLKKANEVVNTAQFRARMASINFGGDFAEERRARYMSGKRAASELGVSQVTLSKLENGAKQWTDKLAACAIELLEVKL